VSLASKAAVRCAPTSFRRLAEPDGIAAGEDDLGTLSPDAPGCLKPDARAASDHHDRLPGQLRFVLACVTAPPGHGHDADEAVFCEPSSVTAFLAEEHIVIDNPA
jgi:hypothetical protein